MSKEEAFIQYRIDGYHSAYPSGYSYVQGREYSILDHFKDIVQFLRAGGDERTLLTSNWPDLSFEIMIDLMEKEIVYLELQR